MLLFLDSQMGYSVRVYQTYTMRQIAENNIKKGYYQD